MITNLELFIGSPRRLKFIFWLADCDEDWVQLKQYYQETARMDSSLNEHVQRLASYGMVARLNSIIYGPRAIKIIREHPYWTDVVPAFRAAVVRLERVSGKPSGVLK